jgi:segregation and condensation protein B
MSDRVTETNITDLSASLEALLFVASAPVPLLQLAETLQTSVENVEQGLACLEEIYRQNRGLSIQWHGGRVQLTTAPAHGLLVERFLGFEATVRLSRAALETLAIIAYRQPITRPGIDAIRGVNSDGVLKSLLSKGLVLEVGRTEGPGRPILYGSSPEFLQHFGLSSLDQLPPFERPEEEDIPQNKNGILKD